MQVVQSLPQPTIARIAGGLYLAVVALSIFALTGMRGISVAGDAVATADNLLRGAAQYRLAVVANLIAALCYIGVVGLLNELLKPVQPGISRLAVLFGLGGCVIGAMTGVLQLTAVALAAGSAPSAAVAPSVQALLIAASRGNSVGLTLFGCYCLLLGWLVIRSGFIPKVFGALLLLSGATWLGGNLALLLQPNLAGRLILIVGVAALGEILFALWLFLKGVDLARSAASARSEP